MSNYISRRKRRTEMGRLRAEAKRGRLMPFPQPPVRGYSIQGPTLPLREFMSVYRLDPERAGPHHEAERQFLMREALAEIGPILERTGLIHYAPERDRNGQMHMVARLMVCGLPPLALRLPQQH